MLGYTFKWNRKYLKQYLELDDDTRRELDRIAKARAASWGKDLSVLAITVAFGALSMWISHQSNPVFILAPIGPALIMCKRNRVDHYLIELMDEIKNNDEEE